MKGVGGHGAPPRLDVAISRQSTARSRMPGNGERSLKACFVGFGEVAAHFCAALHGKGAEVLAYDVLLKRAGGREKLAARARGRPPELAPLDDALERADIILSTVTTDVALEAARSCAPHLRAGQLFIDLNATSPAVKREIAAVVNGAGADFVEGAILSAIGVAGAGAKVLVCGERAEEAARTLSALGLNLHDYGREIGRASSFKMLRSVFSKGIEALLVESLLAARRAGVEQDLWREIVATIDAAPFAEVGGNWIRTHAAAHERRWHEMVQVAAVLRELGLDAPMTEATVKLFGRSTRLRLREAFPAPPASEHAVVAELDQRMSSTREKPSE
jgi:3-hydroxyisobutyrate dehydrogenase-like beta-hydroxyacid dehydrogenase